MLGKSKRHLNRYKEIARVLVKHGWGWMLDRIGIAEHIGIHNKIEPPAGMPIRLRETLEELGPTFVKLGQLLSTRPDIIPEIYITELTKLQDTAPTIPISEIHQVIESEFDNKVRNLFLSFDSNPLAAASLGQVHKATLHDGTQVIVKVQRPNIREVIDTDIEILYKRAQFLEQRWETARTYGISDVVDEFAMTLREELDYTREARNTEILKEKMATLKGVLVPCVHWSLTTSKVLTLELMQGVKITSVKDELPDLNRSELAMIFADAFLQQVFMHSFFHSDPHPGNILVNKNGDIAILDCGQVGRLNAENRAGTVRLLLAFEEQNSRAFAEEILELGISQDDIDVRKFTQDISKVLRNYYDLPARAVNMGALLLRVLHVSAKHKTRLPAIFAVLGKAFANVDGICRQLDPDFNFTQTARTYVGKAMKSELKSESTVSELYRAASGIKNLLLSMPEQTERILRKVVEGTLRIEFKHQGLEEVSKTFRDSANRISIALIVGSMIVGSSIVSVINTSNQNSWYGIPLIGIGGYVIATIFGVWLISSIIRSRK